MQTLLITAFEPYDCWSENSSWLALVEFTKNLPNELRITTRRYPVDFQKVREQLERDLIQNDFDVAIHLGQAPGATCLQFESVGLNIGGNSSAPPGSYLPLVPDGPVAYRSELPLSHWVKLVRDQKIPADISFHAGTYLCNATLYLSHHIAALHGLRTKVTFLHCPLDSSQVVSSDQRKPSLPATMTAAALHAILADMIRERKEGLARSELSPVEVASPTNRA